MSIMETCNVFLSYSNLNMNMYMMTESRKRRAAMVAGVLFAASVMPSVAQVQEKLPEPVRAESPAPVRKAVCGAPEGKEVYIPKELRDNDFTDPESKWSFARSACTGDVIVFWEKPFGPDPGKAPDLEGHNMKVDIDNLLRRVQAFYDVYKNDMEFIRPGSNADRYRMMVMLNYSLEGTAYGGSYDGVIGALWISPNRVQDRKLNCIAHELGHSFQFMIAADGQGESWGGGGIYEMTSQWMLFYVNPEWPTDENYHWKDFVRQANLRFLDAANVYHSPYMLEYWSMRHGPKVIADLYRAGRRGDDPAKTYMQMFGLGCREFAMEAVDCYSRLLTFDFPGKREANRKYSGELLNDKELHTFGANVMRLPVEAGRKSVRVTFRGQNADGGYAYRLVALSGNGEPTYGDIRTGRKGRLRMRLPEGTDGVYLVVTGYPLGDYRPYTLAPHGKEPSAPEPVYGYEYEVR